MIVTISLIIIAGSDSNYDKDIIKQYHLDAPPEKVKRFAYEIVRIQSANILNRTERNEYILKMPVPAGSIDYEYVIMPAANNSTTLFLNRNDGALTQERLYFFERNFITALLEKIKIHNLY